MDQNEIVTDEMVIPSSVGRSTPTINQYLTIFQRRRTIFVMGFICTTVLGVLITLLTPPVFRATASLLVEPQSLKFSQIEAGDPLAPLFEGMQDYKLETQVRLLQSKNLLDLTRKKLSGRALPKFTARTIRETDIIEVVAEGRDPVSVADAANALLATYIDEVADRNGKELNKALAFTTTEAEKALIDLEKNEGRLLQFKQRYKIADIDRDMLAESAAYEKIRTDNQNAVTKLASVRAQIALVNQQLQKEPHFTSTINGPESDTVVQNLELQLTPLLAQRQALLQRYTRINEKVVNVDIQIAALEKQIQRQRTVALQRSERLNPVYESLRQKIFDLDGEALAAATDVASSSRLLVNSQSKLSQFPVWTQELARIQREVELARSKYNLLSTRREDVRLRLQTRRVNARVMEQAQPPNAPFSPNKPVNIVFSLLLGIIVGGSLALFQEYMDDRVNNIEDITRMLMVPQLAAIPSVGNEELRIAVSPQMQNAIQRFSPVTEAFRTLRTSIRFAAAGSRLTAISVTSSTPGEGKSTISLNLAAALGIDEKTVILVDADLRRPTLHKLLGLKREQGLSDVLAGACTIEEVLRPTPVTNVRFISAGSIAPNPSELLGSDSMARFLDTARTLCDVVVLDTPPVLVVADASIVATKMDGVVFVVAMGQATWGRVRHSLETLARVQARVLGITVNKLDTSGRNGYGSGYYSYEYSSPDDDGDPKIPSGNKNAPVEALPDGNNFPDQEANARKRGNRA